MTQPATRRGGQPPAVFVALGERFGRGVVTDPEVRVVTGKRVRRGARLRCDCGARYQAPLSELASGHTRSCGCLGRERFINSSTHQPFLFVAKGDRFGRGTVIDPEVRVLAAGKPAGRRGARLRCDCGTEYEATLTDLKRGERGGVRSCGCLARETGRPPELFVRPGERFGRGVVIDLDVRVGRDNKRGARLRCDCGAEYETTLARLASGHTLSCGCLQRDNSAERGRRRGFQEFWSVPRAGADHEQLAPLDTEHCPYCDRDIPWPRWEAHVTREQRQRGITA